MTTHALNKRTKTGTVLSDYHLRRLADVLLLNGSFAVNPGLLKGKMGIAIFMYNYARSTGSELYKNYAGELLDEIYEEISTSTPVDFENGLTGIGWGLEYLIKNGFVEADTDEALSEIDSVIYKTMMQQPVLIVDGCDLFGYGLYYLARLRGSAKNDENLSSLIKKHILIYLIDECERLLVFKRYLDFNIKSLGIDTINSLSWFLIEMDKLELFPSKTDKLLRHLPSELEFTVKTDNDPVKQYVLFYLIQQIIPRVSGNEIRHKYEWLAKLMLAAWKDFVPHDVNSLTDSFSSLTWQKLIFSPVIEDYKESYSFYEKVLSVTYNEDDWLAKVERLSYENIGLNGLAGLGLGLLGGMQNQIH